MEEYNYMHYSKKLSFPIRKDDGPTICGLDLNHKFSVTNHILLVTCPKCLIELKNKKTT